MSEIENSIEIEATGKYTTETDNNPKEINLSVISNNYIVSHCKSAHTSERIRVIYTYTQNEEIKTGEWTNSIFFNKSNNDVINFGKSFSFEGIITIPAGICTGTIDTIIIGEEHTYDLNKNLVNTEGWIKAENCSIEKDQLETLYLQITITFTVSLSGSIKFFNRAMSGILNDYGFPVPLSTNGVYFSALNLDAVTGDYVDNNGMLLCQIPTSTSIPYAVGFLASKTDVKGEIRNIINSSDEVHFLDYKTLNVGIPRTLVYSNIGAHSVFNETPKETSNEEPSEQPTQNNGQDQIKIEGIVDYPCGYYKSEYLTEKGYIFCCLPNGTKKAGSIYLNDTSINSTFIDITEADLIYPNNELSNAIADSSHFYSNYIFEEGESQPKIWIPNNSCPVCMDTLIFNANTGFPRYYRLGANISIGSINYIPSEGDNEISLSVQCYNSSQNEYNGCDYSTPYKIIKIIYPEEELPTTGELKITLNLIPKTNDTNYWVNEAEQAKGGKMYDPHVILFSGEGDSEKYPLTEIGLNVNNLTITEGSIIYVIADTNNNFYKANHIIGELSYTLDVTTRGVNNG